MKKWLFLLLVILVAVAGIFLLRKPHPPKPLPPPLPRVAIVIDDWGYNRRYLGFLKDENFPVTISVLPNLRYSKSAAEAAQAAGKEVILHLPLEPNDAQQKYVGLEKGTIFCAMQPDEIIALLDEALASVPFACGVSNHMGSKATQDARTMEVIFKQLKKRSLFFLDNVVVETSVSGEVAEKFGVRLARRDVFIDNESDAEYIRGQIAELLECARYNGYAVGVAHARSNTIRILSEELPKIKEEGFELVFISQLVQ